MKLFAIVIATACGVLASGCDQEPKSISVIQQYSDLQSEWQDMALVYGFAFDNVELADVARDSFAKAFPERQYRVVTRQMPQWQYERLKSQIATP
jgi:hypothetical protein